MAKILMCWEMGAGLGHLAVLKPIAVELIQRGHRVSLALRNLSLAPRRVRRTGCRLLAGADEFAKPAAITPTAEYLHAVAG